jgi:transcriptional regulator with XRE-family HTH domain
MEGLGERLKLIRSVLNKTQPEIAELVGVSRQMVSEYENGHTIPGNDIIQKYSSISGRTIEWIRTGADGEKQLYKVQRISTITEGKPFYPANSTFPEAIQLSEQQILEILKLKDSSPLLYKLLETVIERNQKLADYVAKLQSQNAADKQKE